MARIDSMEHFLTDVSSSIKTKLGDSTPIQASDFDTKINSIVVADPLQHKTYTTKENVDNLDITADTNYSGIDDIVLDVRVNEGDNWSYLDIGYTSVPKTLTNNKGYTYAKDIIQATSEPITSISFPSRSRLGKDVLLIYMPYLDTSLVTNFTSMFRNCYSLVYVPVLDVSSCIYFQNVFTNCYSLCDESLDNILQMCIQLGNNGVYSGTKTLSYIGLPQTHFNTITTLPHYQDFLDAGWTLTS